MHSLLRACVLGGIVLMSAGCAGAVALEGRISGLREVIEQADRNGAHRCAPRELAQAEAQLAFAEMELAQGDATRAEEHFVLAQPNAQAAFRLSPPERCAPRTVSLVQPPPPPPAPEDRDGDGITDENDPCPDEPEDFDGYEDEDGCPEDQDSDGDGITDGSDMCVLEPEDQDGYLDADGCPEPDNDLDGIADAIDRCANEPEDIDGFNDTDGCPDMDNDSDSIADAVDRCPNEPGPAEEDGCPRVYENVEVTSTHIRITQKVHFEFNRAVIQEISFGLLNTVAQVMRDFPDIRIEVQGHTDSRGGDDYNQRLSQERADAVMQYLTQQGIDASRMTARGYGEAQPIESNRTREGRAANRRVEFVRTDSEAAE